MKNIDKIKVRCFDCFLVLLLLICLSIPSIVLISPTYSKPVKQQKQNYISGCNLYEDYANWIMPLGIEIPSDEPTVEDNDIPEVSASCENEKIESEPEKIEPEPEYIKVNSTGYWNKYNAHCADGTWPTPGVLAGKREWIGKSVDLYDIDHNYIGTYTFHDVGYGRSIGYGYSKLKKGECLGDIEAGLTIDIFFSTESECNSYGRRDVYMVWR